MGLWGAALKRRCWGLVSGIHGGAAAGGIRGGFCGLRDSCGNCAGEEESAAHVKRVLWRESEEK